MATEPGAMSPEDIARAFVDCPGFEWIPGMMPPGVGEYRYKTTNTVEGWIGVPPDTEDPATLAIIAHVLLPKRWPGHSVQVEVFPDGTARVVVLRPLLPGVWGAGVVVFRVSHEPVAVALLRALEASP